MNPSLSQSPILLEPDHFQCLFLIMGFIYSAGLIVLLWDILSNKKLGFFKLLISGLFACLLITIGNLFFFSTVLWTPITFDTLEKFDKWGEIAIPARTIRTGEYEFDIDILVNNKTVAFAIMGYGAVTSFIFIFAAMMRSIGNNNFLPIFNS